MRALAVVAAFATLVIPLAAQQRVPIIDVHMHALAADAQGPPPLGMCTPFPEYPAWDPATQYGDLFIAKLKKPACADPIWSPTTDDELMKQTLAIAERRNIIGVLSGPAADLKRHEVDRGRAAWPGLRCCFSRDRGEIVTLVDARASECVEAAHRGGARGKPC